MDINNGADLTRSFVSKWTSKDPEMKKQAQYTVDSYVRDGVKEHGIARSQILPALKIENNQLDRHEDPTVLRKFVEKEPNSTATYVPLRGMPDAEFIKGALGEVRFGKIESKEHVVNIRELTTYSCDLRKILQDQDIKNLQTVEDTSLINTAETIAAANPAEQIHNFYGGLTKTNWASAQQRFFPNKSIKFALMNVRTFREFFKWDYTSDMGFGTYGADAFSKGILPQVNGIQIIQTIKTDLVTDGVVYFWAPEEFIGKFYTLDEPTTFIEQRKDWLSFSTYEIVGISIIETRCFTKNIFNP